MNIYKVQSDASDSLIQKVADLLMHQLIRSETDEDYEKIIRGIRLSINDPDHSGIIIAEENETVLGIAFFNIGISLDLGDRYIWLNELFVHPEHRNKGIARKLLLSLIYWAEQEGIKSIELETGVNNSVTKHLYNSLGFHNIISNRYGFSF
ncbi:GNAT family N-acetyltransferase [Fictibacillus sp. Mic-4]|uniref:GNAT family N-acetyltransferase n=1 Tax=Fictibacillus TaxID=1329200 RepID=UPI0003FE5AA9|nr:GNAT family N-acetyltransferase [Fictibacillus gelatini]